MIIYCTWRRTNLTNIADIAKATATAVGKTSVDPVTVTFKSQKYSDAW